MTRVGIVGVGHTVGGRRADASVRVGIAVQLVPRLLEECQDIHVLYTIERESVGRTP